MLYPKMKAAIDTWIMCAVISAVIHLDHVTGVDTGVDKQPYQDTNTCFSLCIYAGVCDFVVRFYPTQDQPRLTLSCYVLLEQ